MKRLGFFLLPFCLILPVVAVPEMNVDVCVYGGTSGGVIAAVKAARLGKRVALICDKNHLGGMTSSGLGWTDVGHVGTAYIQGMANEFYTRVNAKYGRNVNYNFEPHVAEAVFNDLVRESGVMLFTNRYLVSVARQGTQIRAITLDDGTLVEAKEYIDASYTGDLMAAAGVSHTIGRESSVQYGESLAGVRPPDTSFGPNVNPYVISNVPASGLLPLIQSNTLAATGTADQLVQTYNFRMCFTQSATNRLPLMPPANYDVTQYELLARYLQANPTLALSSLMTLGTPLPGSKMDINNSGPISTDFVGDSSAYTEADPATRARIWLEHKNYEQGFFYFLAMDPRVPASIRNAMQTWGPCQDEFTDNGGWPWELYVRESRRMVSDYVMTQSNVFNLLPVPDSIGMAGYFTDSHYCERIMVNGVAVNEGTARGDITVPYPIAYRALVPRTNECQNLLVPWSLSASHIAFCSIRMEPTFMILGQAAATAACIAIDDNVPVQDVNVTKLQSQLVADSQNLGSGAAINAANSVIVDDSDTTGVSTVGAWTSSTASAGYYGTEYLHDGNTDKGQDSVTFMPNLPRAGSYQVYVRWTSNANRATNVPVDISFPTGTQTVLVNQTQSGSQWVWLLTTNFNAGTNGYVRIRNAGTTGYVIADAVQFVSNVPVVNLWATGGQAARPGSKAGSFTVSRSGDTNSSLSISLNFGGTAVNGTDYTVLTNVIVLLPGCAATNIGLMPLAAATPVGNKTATITLAANAAYTVGSLTTANILIADSPMNVWRLHYFGLAATDPAVAGDAANPVGDGVPNLIKYALGLNPTLTVTNPIFAYGLDTNGYFTVTYTRPDPPPSDICYQVAATDDLLAWGTDSVIMRSSGVFLNVVGTATVTTLDDAPANLNQKKFFRLGVSRVEAF